MLARRVIVCLDVRDGRVVKGVRFENLRDVGDPAELAQRYEQDGADEIVFLDVTASVERRATLLDVVRRTAERLFIPLTVGGGVRSTDDIATVLRAGADKVSINSAAVASPGLLEDASRRFGAQCVVASIDARLRPSRQPDIPSSWEVWTHGGSKRTALDAVEWAGRCASLGSGEILLTSIDRDGARSGYDLELTRAVAGAVSVPVVASGGAGRPEDIAQVLKNGAADAALVAGIVHDGTTSVRQIKERMIEEHLPVRRSAHV